MPNALAAATSPYLLQHQHNPVEWREWNEATLALARSQNRPILLSVGYAACHWCHVMAHESFENAATAAVMNRLFVNIKVDREERPDLDTVYQQALAVMGQQGGWPLTMFLTPSGEPFWGGTYFPPEPRYGRPGFVQVLEQVAELWRGGNERIASNRKAIGQALTRLAAPEPGEPLPAEAGLAGRAADGRALRHDPWRHRRRPQVPAGADPAPDLGGSAAQRRPHPAPPRAAHARAHLPGRHLRPSRRRLRPLLGRCLLARAALREDALRQRPAPGAAGLGPCRHRRCPVRRAGRGDRGLAAARDAGRGRLRLGTRCRQRGRGGPVLRLGRRRDRPAPGQRRADLPPRLRRDRRRQLGGAQRSQPAA